MRPWYRACDLKDFWVEPVVRYGCTLQGMTAALNIVAALLLTVLPALKPCDCRGFTFFCACALPVAQAGETPGPKAESSHCCCAKAMSDSAEQDSEKTRQPLVPRKHGECMKFAMAEAGQALFDAPLAAPAAPMFFLLWPDVLRPMAVNQARRRDSFERPPPMGLVVAQVHCIRI